MKQNYSLPVKSLTYNEAIDMQEVEQVDAKDFDISYYLEQGFIPANLLPASDSYNGIEDTTSVGGRVTEPIDAIRVSRSISSKAKTTTN